MEQWLQEVAAQASADSGGVPSEFLGDYLDMLHDAAASGRHPTRARMRSLRSRGRDAARAGVGVGSGVTLYLAAARRVWDDLPARLRIRDGAAVRAASEALLHVTVDAVAAFAEGYADEGHVLARREEAARHALIDDLLGGIGDLGDLIERGEPFGLDLTRPHVVAVATVDEIKPTRADGASRALERLLLDQFHDRNVLVTRRHGLLVVIASEASPATARPLGKIIHAELTRVRDMGRIRVVTGRPHPGAYGIARSFEEAREGVQIAQQLALPDPVLEASDLLIYRVLARDQVALLDLVDAVLTPLDQARGGAAPLVRTVEAYVRHGAVATAAAADLNLSVRAVTYRLARVRSLTGLDPTDPQDRFTLQVATMGARLLRWRGTPGNLGMVELEGG